MALKILSWEVSESISLAIIDKSNEFVPFPPSFSLSFSLTSYAAFLQISNALNISVILVNGEHIHFLSNYKE